MIDNSTFSTFQEFCTAKTKTASEFFMDNILFNLGLTIPFNSKYANIKTYILDFIVICDQMLTFFIKMLSLSHEYFTFQKFIELFTKENPQVTLTDTFSKFLHAIFLSNLDKILMLKSKKLSEFDDNEMKNYKLNLQLTFAHSNIGSLENDFKVLLEFEKNNVGNKGFENENANRIFEFDEKELDNLVQKLKEIYCKIKY